MDEKETKNHAEARRKENPKDAEDEDEDESEIEELPAAQTDENPARPQIPPIAAAITLVAPDNGRDTTQPPPTTLGTAISLSSEFDGCREDMFEWERFAVVEEAPADHYYASRYPSPTVDTSFMRNVRKEFKVFDALPDDILVRAFEDRADLLRALIIGPAGTP